MFGNRKVTMLTGLTLTLAGALIASTSYSAAADKRVVNEGADSVAISSQVVAVGLPRNAQRVVGVGDLARYRAVMQDVACNNRGSLSRAEVLRWTGETASTAKNTLTVRLKQAGYTLAHVNAFDSEDGHVTPLAAVPGTKSDSIIGLWVERGDNQTLLIWARFQPSAAGKAIPRAQVSDTAARRAKAYQAYKEYQYATLMGQTTTAAKRSGAGW